MRIKSFLILLAVMVLTTGCNRQSIPVPNSQLTSMNTATSINLKLNETYTVADDFTLEFLDVIADSRCPTEVDCDEAGRVTAQLRMVQAGKELSTFELSGPPYGNTSAELSAQQYASVSKTVGPYHIVLLNVEPYPQTVGQVIPKADYTVTVQVTPR